MKAGKRKGLSVRLERWRTALAISVLVALATSGGGCFLDHPVETFYGRALPPPAQEFRWSDGGLPQTFDPALAAAPPDTDAVRALYEGLTEYDPETLRPTPGVAQRWESDVEARQWTFYLRRDAHWSNGDSVTAHDFVRSWQRTLSLGEHAPHAKLLENIEGVRPTRALTSTPPEINAAEETGAVDNKTSRQEVKREGTPPPRETKREAQAVRDAKEARETKEAKYSAIAQTKFGAEAVSDFVLRVRLQRPDADFPALVAHPVFRPVHEALSDDHAAQASASSSSVVSNGPFRLSQSGRDAVVLERAGNYWDAAQVSLERVRFVAAADAESALAAYRAGEVDVVTNAGFEPLALKLLSAYKDFHRATYGALTYYSFNQAHAPFDDARVREALAIALDRDRIAEDEMGGAPEPAERFLPETADQPGDVERAQLKLLVRDVERAQSLLAEAGYPQGRGFPPVRLLINRNEQQRMVAQSVASMWRSTLGIETEIVVKSWDEYEAALRAGDYDVVRRGLVMQTTDEETNMRLMFEPVAASAALPQADAQSQDGAKNPGPKNGAGAASAGAPGAASEKRPEDEAKRAVPYAQFTPPPVLSEAQALREVPAIPIYFASSYALVKPYVVGFDANMLDAPSLKRVRVNTNWQPPKQPSAAWLR